jgi:glycosyltransferase involved in cell wall biosynthesis
MSLSQPIRVAEVITGLERGGAELMLLRLLGALDRRRFAPQVLSLRPAGVIAAQIEALDIPVHSAGIRGALPGPAGLRRFTRQLCGIRPDLIHTWMYHADLLGGVIGRALCRVPVIWALHNSTLDPARVGVATRLTVRVNALLSRVVPARIVSCSQAAADVHRALGYPSDRLMVIPNGFDVEVYRPDADARRALRSELCLAENAALVGSFARFHPQKDHRTLCRAAGLIAVSRPDVHFVLAGGGVDADNSVLVQWLRDSGAVDHCHLLGERDDMPRLTAALDLALMTSSFGEAFPLVIGEAMACGVPCVATDVGDAQAMVGDIGRVVPPRDPHALAASVLELLALGAGERAALGRRARAKIAAELSLGAVADRYAALYETVIDEHQRSGWR